jgi:hypothetical protein
MFKIPQACEAAGYVGVHPLAVWQNEIDIETRVFKTPDMGWGSGCDDKTT